MTDEKKKGGYGNLRPELREKYMKHLKKDPEYVLDVEGFIEIDGERLEIEVDWSEEEEDDENEQD